MAERGQERRPSRVHTSIGIPVPDGQVQCAGGDNGTRGIPREQAHDAGHGRRGDRAGRDRGYPDLKQR
eukprot:1794201-Heterocapsa_arctica.AAC.1